MPSYLCAFTSLHPTIRDRTDIVEIVSDAVLGSPEPEAIRVRAALHNHIPMVAVRLGELQVELALQAALNVLIALEGASRDRPTRLPSLTPFFDAVCRAYLGAMQLSFAHRVRG